MQKTTLSDGMKASTPNAIVYTASVSWGTNRSDLWRHAWRNELMRSEPYIMQVHVNLGQDSRASGAVAWAQGPSATQTGRATHVCADQLALQRHRPLHVAHADLRRRPRQQETTPRALHSK